MSSIDASSCLYKKNPANNYEIKQSAKSPISCRLFMNKSSRNGGFFNSTSSQNTYLERVQKGYGDEPMINQTSVNNYIMTCRRGMFFFKHKDYIYNRLISKTQARKYFNYGIKRKSGGNKYKKYGCSLSETRKLRK
jgi:hypothetical protein